MVEDYENGGSPHNNRKMALGVTSYLYKYSTRAVSTISNALPGHHDHHRCGQGYCLLIAHRGTFFEEIPRVPIFV